MNSRIPLIACATFFVSLCVHVVHWRWKAPKRDVVALIATFLLLPAAAIAALGLASSLFSPEELVAVYLLHFILSGVYIAMYPAVPASSPSLEILMLFRGCPEGLTREEIVRGFNKVSAVSARVRDLVDSKLVVQRDGKLTPTPNGRRLSVLFALYRRSLGLPVKGG